MGYLDNASVTVDAVLTKLGREKLAQGEFSVTKFALGDDEINYSLYDTSHNLGSAYYGEAIERMPLLEAFINDPQTLKNRLVTLPKNTQILPVVSIPQSSVTVNTGQIITISPQTLNVSGGNDASGYSFTIANSDIVRMAIQTGNTTYTTRTGAQAVGGATYSSVSTATGFQSSFTSNGSSIQLTGLAIANTTTTTLTITGNDTGGSVSIPVTINRDTSLD